MDSLKAKETKDALLLMLCVFINTIPLFMFFLFEWSIFDLIFLYWAENAIVGVLIFGKMLFKPFAESNLITAFYFLMHYGMFCCAHLTLIFSIFGEDISENQSSLSLFENLGLVLNEFMLASLVAFFIFHLIDFIKGDVYKDFDVSFKEMITPRFLKDNPEKPEAEVSIFSTQYGPYIRIFVLHITLIGTAVVIDLLGLHIAFGLLLLVLVKTIADIHYRYEYAQPAETSS